MPELLSVFMMALYFYVFGGGMVVSGIIGIVLNVFSIICKKKKQLRITNNIVYCILLALAIILSWLLFHALMSV